MLTAEDIEKARLRRSLVGGYSAAKVRELLRAVAWDYRIALHDRSRLEEEVAALREELARRDREDAQRGSTLRSAEHGTTDKRATSPVERAGAEHPAHRKLTDVERRSRPFRSTLSALLRPRTAVQGGPAAENPQRGLMEDLEHAVQTTRASAVDDAPSVLPEAEALSGESDRDPVAGDGETDV